MNIFFDVDYTWLGIDGSLRPGTQSTLERLIADGNSIYIWSGAGIRWTDVEKHNLTPFVIDCFVKPMDNYAEKVEQMNLPVKPDIVIDDYPEVPTALGGFWIRPYFYHTSSDNEMEHMYQIITEYIRTGHSNDTRFKGKAPHHE